MRTESSGIPGIWSLVRDGCEEDVSRKLLPQLEPYVYMVRADISHPASVGARGTPLPTDHSRSQWTQYVLLQPMFYQYLYYTLDT